MWLDLQIQILDAKWLQKHPDTWYKDAILESECFISKQANGKSSEDPSQTHQFRAKQRPSCTHKGIFFVKPTSTLLTANNSRYLD